jgi:regulator of sirC expression with transglutaminase-like and TPR domain
VAEVEPTARFTALLHGPEASLPLDEAALLIAAHAHQGLDVDAQLRRIDALADGVREPTLTGVRRHLFGDLGFAGDEVDYYDPRNSYLDTVLDRRVGIPITLSVVLMEVGRRLGVPLAGVSMPGHFLVRDKVDPDVFVDPFARGRELDRRGAELRFHSIQGPGAVFDPAFLEPVGRRAIIARMLANLETAATMRSDRFTLSWVLGLRAALPDAAEADRRKFASVLAATGRFVEAAEVFDVLGDEASAARLRAKLN